MGLGSLGKGRWNDVISLANREETVPVVRQRGQGDGSPGRAGEWNSGVPSYKFGRVRIIRAEERRGAEWRQTR